MVTSLLLRRFSSKSCRALIHHTSFFTTTTFNSSSSSSSSSKFGGGGTFILHHQQAANSLHTTTTSSSSSSKFGTIILQTNEPSPVHLGSYGEEIKRDDMIKMFMLSSRSGSDGEEEEEEEDKDDDDDDDQKNKKMKKKKKKKKEEKKMVFKLDEDLGFSAVYKDFNLQDSIRMVGSCNGIICLHDPEVEGPLGDVYLWNPATRHFRILPGAKLMDYKAFVGFGFDVETQDYKVLRITPFVPYGYSGESGGDGCKCRVQVYSLSTDSWRVLDGIDSLPLSPTQDLFGNHPQGTYLNGTGSCFFLGSKPINRYGIRDLILLSFDFTKEIFTIMELPECLSRGKVKKAYCYKLVLSSGDDFDDVLTSPVGLYDIIRDDKPVVFRTPRKDLAGGYVFTTPQIDFKGGYWYYCMWMLGEQNESGSRVVEYKPKSWTRLLEFRLKAKGKHPYCEPRCVSNDREFALISTSTDDNGRKKLMLFNLVTKKAVEDFTIGDRDCRAAYVYKESQVSIMGAGNALLRWQLPTHGTTYKLNLYAPFIEDDLHLGIGLCLTSDTGGCIKVRSLRRCIIYPEDAEALAMLEAIEWAKELELSPIIIESDSKNMVSFFMEDDTSFMQDYDDYNLFPCGSSSAGSFLEEAKLLHKSSENSISFQYCSRSSNYVAEIASKLGSDERESWHCKDWTANFPGEVVMSLSEDLGLVLR